MPSRRTQQTKKTTHRQPAWSPINRFEAFKTAPALAAVGSREKSRYDLAGLTPEMRRHLEVHEMDVARRYLIALNRARTDVGSRIGAELLDMAEGVSRRAFATPMKDQRFTGATAIHAGLCDQFADPGALKGYGHYLPAPRRDHALPFDDFLSGDPASDGADLGHLLGPLPEGILNVYSMRDSLSVEFAADACENAVVGGFAMMRRSDMVWWTAVGGVIVDFDDVERQLKTFTFKGLDAGKDRVIRPRVVPLPDRPDAWKQRLSGIVDLSGRELETVCEWFLDPEIRIERDVTGPGEEDDVFRHLKKAAMLCFRLPAYFADGPSRERRLYSLTESGATRADDEPRPPRRAR